MLPQQCLCRSVTRSTKIVYGPDPNVYFSTLLMLPKPPIVSKLLYPTLCETQC